MLLSVNVNIKTLNPQIIDMIERQKTQVKNSLLTISLIAKINIAISLRQTRKVKHSMRVLSMKIKIVVAEIHKKTIFKL